jgi:protoheme IX farnesyltransferase
LQIPSLNKYFRLIRFPVTLAVTFSGFAAAFIQSGKVSWPVMISMAGIFLLAAGASALNQYQEWHYDELMERTRKRPIPARLLTTADAQRVSMLLIIGGILVFIYQGLWTCFVLGVFNLLWYNGLYTILKRKTAFAVVPGALTGAVPVLMGWSAAGDDLTSPVVLFLAFFIFLWQMPHFWLIMLKYGDEYRKAGFPVLNDIFSERQMKTIILFWMLASSAAAIQFLYFGIVTREWVRYLLTGFNILVLAVIVQQLFLARKVNFRVLFIAGNIFMMLVLLLVMADKF